MQTRRETLKQSAVVAGLLASAGFPQFAHAAFNKAAFDAKSVQEAAKAAGAASLAESKDVPSPVQTSLKTALWSHWGLAPLWLGSSNC